MNLFDYDKAFQRNTGLFSPDEQKQIRYTKVAIAGLGGMGGGHAICLARLGFTRFHLADLDTFDMANINRQLGATMKTIGVSKVDAIEKALLEINPDCEITKFPAGLHPHNANEFFNDIDLAIDAIDFFQMETRKLFYAQSKKLGIPTIFTAPLGYSSTIISFSPESMKFEDYFQIYEDTSYFDSLVNLVAGIAPGGLHWSYLNIGIDDILNKRGPSLSLACFLGHSMMATEAAMHILEKRKPLVAPYSVQIDLMRGKYKRVHLRSGVNSFRMRIIRKLIARKFQPARKQIEATGLKQLPSQPHFEAG